MTWIEAGKLLVQVVVAVGGLAGIVALLLVGAQKRKLVSESGKTDAEADTVLADAYSRRAATQVSLIGPYERVVERMQAELDEALEKIDRLTDYVEVVVAIAREAGLHVPPMPRPTPPPSGSAVSGRRRRR